MEISFYVLLVLACLVLLLAMWACAGSGTSKWGPDLTLELPPHLLQEALFGHKQDPAGPPFRAGPTPSAPSELPGDPLLSNEHGMGKSAPPAPRYHRPAPRPPPKPQHQVLVNMEGAVRVLPPSSQFPPVPARHKLKPVFSTFERA